MLHGIHILLVEDNVLNQKIGKYILLKQNAEVTVVSNGKEAIDQMHLGHFDAVLMDIYMPVMDGYEATRIIRGELKNPVPIVALTASVSANDDVGYISAGMDATISKPFEPVSLCTLILKLIEEKKLK